MLVAGDLPSVRTVSYRQVMAMQRWRFSSLPFCGGKAFSRQFSSRARNRTGRRGERQVFGVLRVEARYWPGRGVRVEERSRSVVMGPHREASHCATRKYYIHLGVWRLRQVLVVGWVCREMDTGKSRQRSTEGLLLSLGLVL